MKNLRILSKEEIKELKREIDFKKSVNEKIFSKEEICERGRNSVLSNVKIIERLEERSAPDILRGYTYVNIRKNYLKPLVDAGRVAKYNVTPQGPRIWLGVEGGALSQRTYTPTTARDNV